jgi:hypothetical protein
MNNNVRRRLFLFGVLLAVVCTAGASQLYTLDPGEASARVAAQELSLSNAAVSARWSTADGRFQGLDFVDRWSGQTVRLPQCPFSLIFREAGVVKASGMRLVGSPKIEVLAGDPNASRLAERFGGRQIVLKLKDPDYDLTVIWRGILRDGSNYIRQEIAITANNADLPIAEVRLVDGIIPGAQIVGVVKGSPVIAGDFFAGFEHPLAEVTVSGDRVIYRMPRELPLKAGQTVTYSSVLGVAPAGQMRRAFLNYVERERAHPYRTFLHYNSWYDIGYGNQYDESAATNVINAFGKELAKKRGVKIDSFLFDDGWDDPATLWHFDSGFPNGFTPLKAAAAEYGAAPGVWLSPWGGYNEAKQKRLKYAREEGFESNDSGFALSGPKYYSRFRDITLEFIKKYGVNQFKIDGTGNVNSAYPGSEFDSDFHAAISLIREWRRIKPDIYVNLTTGTYPSPFWLQYADSIWRGGEDHSFAGVGSWRQRWITYRDAETYEHVVQAGPLFPLNSLMLHGLIYAKQAEHLNADPKNDFSDEVHSFFGSGTQLQEMYITPALLSQENWDTLAEAAKWARANADVLVDTHWIGGDPSELEVYGWTSWAPQKGIIVLRNPSDKSQDFVLDVGAAFELPVGAAQIYEAKSPWTKDREEAPIMLQAGKRQTFHLAPFQVITLEAVPK